MPNALRDNDQFAAVELNALLGAIDKEHDGCGTFKREDDLVPVLVALPLAAS